jgi:sialate O-acetylesterase
MEKAGNKITVKFTNVDKGLKPLDVGELKGFAVAGEDKKWHWAEAKIAAGSPAADTVEISSPDVSAPVAVRYAWADNPVCNLYSLNGLPVTPFRTDDWPGVTAEVK